MLRTSNGMLLCQGFCASTVVLTYLIEDPVHTNTSAIKWVTVLRHIFGYECYERTWLGAEANKNSLPSMSHGFFLRFGFKQYRPETTSLGVVGGPRTDSGQASSYGDYEYRWNPN